MPSSMAKSIKHCSSGFCAPRTERVCPLVLALLKPAQEKWEGQIGLKENLCLEKLSFHVFQDRKGQVLARLSLSASLTFPHFGK